MGPKPSQVAAAAIQAKHHLRAQSMPNSRIVNRGSWSTLACSCRPFTAALCSAQQSDAPSHHHRRVCCMPLAIYPNAESAQPAEAHWRDGLTLLRSAPATRSAASLRESVNTRLTDRALLLHCSAQCVCQSCNRLQGTVRRVRCRVLGSFRCTSSRSLFLRML